MLTSICIRKPSTSDGAGVFDLVKQCPPLDTNSMYCNLLQCTHFADTSAAAELDGQLVGFVSGYIVPDRPDTLFIWQVAVSPSARGCGLAGSMIKQIMSRRQCREIKWIETTVTSDNRASLALFNSLADRFCADLKQSLLFDKQRDFKGAHDSEMILRIGPLQTAANNTLTA